jgi:hypothetical protein
MYTPGHAVHRYLAALAAQEYLGKAMAPAFLRLAHHSRTPAFKL